MSVALMSQAIGELRRNCAAAATAIGDTTTITVFGWEAIGSETSKDHTLGALRDIQQRIAALDLRQADVIAGRWSSSSWFAAAGALHEDIRSHWSSAGEWSMSGVLSSTYDATKGEVTALAKDAIAEAKFPLGMVALIVVGLVVLRVI